MQIMTIEQPDILAEVGVFREVSSFLLAAGAGRRVGFRLGLLGLGPPLLARAQLEPRETSMK